MSTIVEEARAIIKQAAQRRCVEEALRRDKTISVTAAWEGVYGAKIQRLAARVRELRQAGWEIRTEEKGETYYHLISEPKPQQLTLA